MCLGIRASGFAWVLGLELGNVEFRVLGFDAAAYMVMVLDSF